MAPRRPNWDEYFMIQAELAKLRSNCMMRKVGAVIVKDHRQLATGYNGTPQKMRNCYEGGCQRCVLRVEGSLKSGEMLDKCLCMHAEANAIMHCAIMGVGSMYGSILYSTDRPCLECSKMAITVGIRRFVYMLEYPEDIQDLVEMADVQVIRMDPRHIRHWIRTLARHVF